MYFFLFAAIGVILLLIVCICYQCRVVKNRNKQKRFGSSLLSNNLLISSAKPEKRHFFRQNHNQNHQTVCIASNTSVGKFWSKGNATCGSSSSSGSSSAGSTGSTRSSGCASASQRPKVLTNIVSDNLIKNGEHGAMSSDISSLVGSSVHTTPCMQFLKI